ncbi:MAG: RNA methyltransferase [Betaproteobacteria bacterium]|nr:RNA methyltransferase [Betaproteobacteria bacterium]
MKLITSRANAVFRALARLKESPRHRRTEHATVIDGAHLVSAYLERLGHPQAVVVTAAAAESPEIRALLKRVAPLNPIMLSEALFREVSPVAAPAGILAAIEIPAARAPLREAECCLLVEDIQDPGNLGSILRSAAAAGVEQVLLSKGCADVWSPRVLRAGMGAHFLLNLAERVDLSAFASEYRGRIVATAANASNCIFDVDLTQRTAFAVGNEGAGLSGGLLRAAHVVAAIPMRDGAESINVGAATAVCLFERVRQIRSTAGTEAADRPPRRSS